MGKQPVPALNYRDLTIATFKQKYSYFFLGFAVLALIVLVVVEIVGSFLVNLTVAEPKKVTTTHPKVAVKPVPTGVYTVKAGDYLCKISETFYGSCSYADTIMKVNNLTDPNQVQAGVQLIIPTITPSISPTAVPSNTPTATSAGQIDNGAAYDSVHLYNQQ